MKLIYLDVETTGLNAYMHGIYQLSGMVEIEGEIIEKFDIKMNPLAWCKVTDDALKACNMTLAEIESYPAEEEGFVEFKSVLNRHINPYKKQDKFLIVGYNSNSFDQVFLRAFFKRNNDKYFGSYFWSGGTIDVMVLALNDLRNERAEIENFKLGTVAEKYGIGVEDDALHNAFYDVELTREIYQRIVKNDKPIL